MPTRSGAGPASDIDIHACSRCIRDLLLVAKIRREDDRIGVIANRIRRNTSPTSR